MSIVQHSLWSDFPTIQVHCDDPDLYVHISNAGPEAHDLGPEHDENSLFPYSELTIRKGWDPTGLTNVHSCMDDAVMVRHYGGDDQWAFAGVFDGHGYG